jgi:tellurite resistance protein TehA-like permease
MIEITVMLFVAAVLVFVAYALVRPFTHTHYRHPSQSQWRPLD